jgi:hypothetical protein
MNVSIINHETFAETICEAKILTTLEGPGAAQTYVCEHGGVDILIISDPVSGGAIVVHSCAEDREAGGSVHDHARASIL